MAFPSLAASSQSGPSGFGAGSLSITKPACNVGDTLVVFLIGKNFTGNAMTLDLSGFTEREDVYFDIYLYGKVYDRVIDGSEAATFTATATNDAYLYAYAFTVPQSAYHASGNTGQSSFDPGPGTAAVLVTEDTLGLSVIFQWSDALTAQPATWTAVYTATDGIGYAYQRNVANPGVGFSLASDLSNTDRWISLTAAYEQSIVNVDGTTATTDAADTPAFTGSVTVPGTTATTDADDVFAGTGTAPLWASGTITTTDETDSFVGLVADMFGAAHMVDGDTDSAYIFVNRYGGAPTVRREDGPVFLNRRRRRYYNPSHNPVTGP